MRKLLPSFGQLLMRAMLFGLFASPALFTSAAFGQSATDQPGKLMAVTTQTPAAKPFFSQTEFSYQGQLRESGMPANGIYDIQFTLYASQTDKNALASIVHEDVVVTNGQFSVKLDFGRIGADGKELWLELALRYGSSADACTTLAPRQRLTSAPYAILAQRESWSLIGVPVGFFEGISDARTSDPLNVGSGKAGTPDNIEETPGGAIALGTSNFLAKFDGAGNPTANSILFDNGASVSVGTTVAKGKFHVASPGADANTNSAQLAITETTLNSSLLLGKSFAYGFLQSTNSHPLALNPIGNNVGIGIITPHYQLSLGSSLANTKLALYESGLSGESSYGLGVRPGAFRLHVNSSQARFAFFDSPTDSAREIVTIRGTGDVIITGKTQTKALEITGGSDLAEPFEIGDVGAIKPGMVVTIDPARSGHLRLAYRAYDKTVAGVVSGANGINPGLTMKQEGTVADGSLPVALSGRVYCWADASYGSIKPGDLLTTSKTPGHARKVTNSTKAHGAIIGKAMTGLKSGKGLVLVLVTLQ